MTKQGESSQQNSPARVPAAAPGNSAARSVVIRKSPPVDWADEGAWWQVRLGDGRSLEVVTAGRPDGMPLVFHYGTPMAALPFAPFTAAAARHGLLLVTWSRPGCAGSPAQPGRRVADVAADTAAVLDALGADTFVTIGWSGGGSGALACAALLPGRCRAAASLAGFAPHGADGLDWLAGMGPESVIGFEAAVADTELFSELLEAVAPTMLQAQPEDMFTSLGGAVSAVDKASFTGDFAAFMAASVRRALSEGIAGWRDDHLASVAEWGFDPAGITTPVAVWQGAQDQMVPFDHGPWLASHIPGATAHLYPDEGHLSLVIGHFAEVVDDLMVLADVDPTSIGNSPQTYSSRRPS